MINYSRKNNYITKDGLVVKFIANDRDHVVMRDETGTLMIFHHNDIELVPPTPEEIVAEIKQKQPPLDRQRMYKWEELLDREGVVISYHHKG